ncbi:hypothetical protein ACOMHN_006935 [Nucella lapillus]
MGWCGRWSVFLVCLYGYCLWMGAASLVKRSASGGGAAAASFPETEDGQLTVVTNHGAPIQEHHHGQESQAERETELYKTSDWEIIRQQLKETGNTDETDDMDEYFQRDRRSLTRRKRFMSNNKRSTWPKGIVPYDFNLEATTEFYRREALAAINRWHKYTCIRFVPWVLGETRRKHGLTEESHVTITKGDGCAAHQGNIHSTRGQYNSCCRRYTCVHELGHTLGLWHEHQNPLREDIMKLDRSRVPGKMEWTYNLRYLGDYLVFQYDTSNTMHYGGSAFKILYEDLKPILGFSNQYYMYKDVSLFHQCKELYCANFTGQCHNDGFVTVVDDQCSCLCPPGLDPSTGCATTITQAVTSTSWPAGSFALLSSSAGCPGNEFLEGSWQHQGKGNNRKSDTFHLAGSFNADIFRYQFCVKEDNSDPVIALDWEPGRYCILRVNGACPKDFESGSIQFDDHVNSTGQAGGHLPDGQFTDTMDTRLEFCCRDDGFSSTPLNNLPNTAPLMLFTGNSDNNCQEVTGMYWTKEYFRFDSYKANAQTAGSHPYVSRGTTYQVGFCHYVSADLNCGGEILLTKNNRDAVISSPNFPLTYGPNMECNWFIKAGEEGGQVMLNFDVMKVTSYGNDCRDSLEIRYNLPGQPGIRYCGDGLGRTIRSVNNSIVLTLRTDSRQVPSDTGFNLTASLHIPEEDSCYEPSTKGSLYRGQKNYTRGMKPCLPWTQVANCQYHAFHPRDFGSGLEENYCRNPDNTVMPWCYIDQNCNRDFCDVCNIERIYDRSSLCPSDLCAKSAEKIIQAGCAQTCGLQHPPAPSRDATCGEPEKSADSRWGQETPAGKSSAVGQTVSLLCRTGPEDLNVTCLADGQWSPAGYVCGACKDGWAVKNGSCYKYYKGPETFIGAQQWCGNYGAIVASMRNDEEQAFVSSLRQHFWAMWIGVTDREVEDEFRWEDGTLVDWFNWFPGKSHVSGSKDCVSAKTEYANITWVIESCTRGRRPFVCQYELSERTLCADRHRNCESMLLKLPDTCTQQPDFADQMCPYSCGLCLTESTPPCNIQALDNVTVVSPQGQQSVTRGSVVQLACREGFVLTQGQMSLACGKDGQLIGTLPVCKDPESIIQDSNDVELKQRSKLPSYSRAYTSVGSNLGITRHGVIKQWTFYSPENGLTFFQVWRPNPAGGNYSYNLVGQTQVESRGVGEETYNMDEADWIPVQPGDSIGMYELRYWRAQVPYDSCKAEYNPADYGVIRTVSRVNYVNFSPSASYQFTSSLQCQTFSFRAVIHPVTSVRANPDLPTSRVARVYRSSIGGSDRVYIGDSADFHIPADGNVSTWQFYARGGGSGAVQVWRHRKDLGATQFELIGGHNISITSNEDRPYTVSVPAAERITVKKGDIIGFYYSPTGRLGLPYTFCNPDSYPESGNIHWWRVGGGTLTPGRTANFRKSSGSYRCRIFSLRAVVAQVASVA